jgi:MFS-type transporter involved in bile tolerance (Atg22 family)
MQRNVNRFKTNHCIFTNKILGAGQFSILRRSLFLGLFCVVGILLNPLLYEYFGPAPYFLIGMYPIHFIGALDKIPSDDDEARYDNG